MRYNDPDGRRGERTCIPEVVLAKGKKKEALIEAVGSLLEHHPVLVTKCSSSQLRTLRKVYADRVVRAGEESGCVIIDQGDHPPPTRGRVAICSAGASDLPVAEETEVSSEYLGLETMVIPDCGIAGPHRVEKAAGRIRRFLPDAVIVIAGMEGALPSVLAARVRFPVIAVPTSVGYGTHYRGIATLLAMLNTCVPGVTVVNIDNGFGAAAAAARISGSRVRRRRARRDG